MRNEEIKAIEDGLAGIKSELEAGVERKFDALATEIARKMTTAGNGIMRGHKSNPLAKLAEDAGIKSVAEGRSRSAMVKLDGSIGMLTKSLLVGDVENTDEDLFNVQANRASFIGNDTRRRLSLLDYLPRQKVTSNTFEVNKLSVYTASSGY